MRRGLFVLSVCSDLASEAALRERQTNVEEQAAFAQTADPGEDATKASERADVFGKHGGKSTGNHPTRQDLDAAQRVQEVAIIQLETAQQAATTAQQAADALQSMWLQELNRTGNIEDEKVKKAEAKLQEAEAKLQEAEAKVEKAKQEVEKAELKVEKAKQEVEKAKASVGGVQAGWLLRFCVCSCCCCLWFAAPPQGCCAFRVGSCFPLSKDPFVLKLSPLCWLAALREWEGLSEQRALGFRFRSNLVAPRVFARAECGRGVLFCQPCVRSSYLQSGSR